MNLKELKKNKNFNLITPLVVNKSSSQKKKILKFLNSVDNLYFLRAENLNAFSKLRDLKDNF